MPTIPRADVIRPRRRQRSAGLIVAALCACIGGLPVASHGGALGRSDAGSTLNRPLPADPLELLGSVQRLSGAGLYDDAAAVTRVAEREMLLLMTGRGPLAGTTLRDAIHEADTAAPSVESLRDEALARIRLRISPTIGRGDAQPLAGDDPSLLPATGGEWTTHLQVTGQTLRVPVEVKFEGKGGAIGGLSGQITLLPQHQGRSIVMAVNEHVLAGDRFRHDVAFWVAPRVLSPQAVSESELRAALRGLDSGSFRAQVVIQVAWLTPSEDPKAPFLVVSRGRSAIVDDRFGAVAQSGVAGTAGDSGSASRNVPARCATDSPDSNSTPIARAAPAPRFDRDRMQVPMSSPLMQSVLARPMASDPGLLLDLRALFDVALHPEEAQKLEAIAERSALLAVLGERVDPQGTIGIALAAPAPTGAELALLRRCVMRTAVGIDLVNYDSTHGVDFFGRPYVREAPKAAAMDQSVQSSLALPLEIANQSAALLTAFEFTVRLTPVAGGEPLLLRVDRSGGNALRDRERTEVKATLMSGGHIDGVALEAVAAAARRGEYLAEVTDWTLTYGGEPRFRLSSASFSWLDPNDREAKASQFVAAASCTDTASCTMARTGRGLSSATTWVIVELLAAMLVPIALSRRYTPRRGLAWVYAAYTVAAIGAALLLRLDPPAGGGMSGIISVGAAFMLSLPWPLFIVQLPSLVSGLDKVFLNADAGVISAWIGIAINHLVIGALVFLPRRGADGSAAD